MKKTVYEGKVVDTIDITPTWEAILPSLIAVIQDGNGDGKRLAIEELRRMATIADKYVELTKEKEEENKATKLFTFKDKTGRGITNPNFTLDDILNCEDEQSDNDEMLHEWANECGEGDEWQNRTMKFICTKVN